MPTEPDKHDLLGFPGVEAEHPKWYIRRLWLVAENDRKPFPTFLDKDVQELATHVNKVVNKLAKHEDKRYEELCGGAFLEKDASDILDNPGFGSRIWGEGSGAEIRLQSNLPGSRPRWGVHTDSGYESNDEDSIRLNLRYWMAALIQAKINAPCKEKKRVPSVTVEHVKQPSSVPASQPRPLQSELADRRGPPDTSDLAPSCLERHENRSAAMVGAEPKAASNRSRSRARSDDSVSSFSFTGYIHTGSEADFLQPSSNGFKRQRIDISQGRSHTRSPQHTPEATSTAGVNPSTGTSTNITIPDVEDNNNDIVKVDQNGLSRADQIKQDLQFDLARFLKNELDYTGILDKVIPPIRHLYAISPHREPFSDLYVEFRNFNQALDHWESLIKSRTASSSVTQSLLEDPLQKLAGQGTFEDRVAMLRKLGPRSHIDFPPETLTISLTLFFEGLLGDTYKPFPFKDLVDQLRVVNRPLYDTVRSSE